MPISQKFLQDQIATLEAQIAAIDAALTAFISSNIQSYQLDTGQSEVRVTRANLSELRAWKDNLMNQLAVYCARSDGSGTIRVLPCN